MSAEINRHTTRLMVTTIATQMCAQRIKDHIVGCPICSRRHPAAAVLAAGCADKDLLMADYQLAIAERERTSRELCELEDRP